MYDIILFMYVKLSDKKMMYGRLSCGNMINEAFYFVKLNHKCQKFRLVTTWKRYNFFYQGSISINVVHWYYTFKVMMFI